MPRKSGRAQLLAFLKGSVGEWVHNQTLRRESGLDDVPRTIRELRQEGWDISVRGDGYNCLNSVEQGEAKGRRGTISEKVRYQVLQAGSFRCRACGRGSDDGVKLVIDHIVPVDWGGTSDQPNLQVLCEECNHGKQAWVADLSPETMTRVFGQSTVEARIEALFDLMPDQDVPSSLIQLASRNAFDWQRALRRVRQSTGKRISPGPDRRSYRYETGDEH
jgi:5-methylcytosine-specific restriction endonuclease McrA